MIRVHRISHAAYETPDLAQQTEYYTDVIGLTLVDKGDDAVYLASTVDHHSIVLRHGSEARCTHIGFQLTPDADLAEFRSQVEAHGITVEHRTDAQPGIGALLSFPDAKGTQMEVFTAPEPVHQPFPIKGIVPHKLGHVAFHCSDVQKTTQWYCDVLGFRVSDWMGDFFSFLRCGHDHHTINLVGTGQDAHFHTAFELRDWAHIQTSSDLLSRHGYRLVWGPGRHGIGHNLFTYHRGPNGLIVEFFAELDRMTDESLGYFEPRPWHRDNPQRPKVWERGPGASNFWGPPPPPEMMKL